MQRTSKGSGTSKRHLARWLCKPGLMPEVKQEGCEVRAEIPVRPRCPLSGVRHQWARRPLKDPTGFGMKFCREVGLAIVVMAGGGSHFPTSVICPRRFKSTAQDQCGCVESPLGLQEWAQLSTGRKEVGELQLSLSSYKLPMALQSQDGPEWKLTCCGSELAALKL